jgi:hypothetical protein
MTRLYTTLQANGSTLQKAAENNISSTNPLQMANDLLVTEDALYITGTSYEWANTVNVSLMSADGLSWEPTDYAFTQVVAIDDVLFATAEHTLFASTDSETWSEVTLSFEDELNMDADALYREFNAAQDGSGIGVRVWSADDASDAQCRWSADGVTWSELESCAPVQSIATRSVVQFDDFWYGTRGKKTHSLYRFAL